MHVSYEEEDTRMCPMKSPIDCHELVSRSKGDLLTGDVLLSKQHISDTLATHEQHISNTSATH